MSTVVFYSWQKDLSPKTNRNFIQNALEKAIKDLNSDAEIVLDIRMEKDTKGLPGSPDIAHSIFDKISNAQIFVGDVSFINSDEEPKRLTPNPNVLVELGFAARHLEWDRIICVFNTVYGKVEELPFDLRPRRILSYSATEEIRDKTSLAEDFKIAIKSIISHSETLFKDSHTRVLQLLTDELEYNLLLAQKTDGGNIAPFQTTRFSQAVELNLRSLVSDEEFRKINELYAYISQVNRLINSLTNNVAHNEMVIVRILQITPEAMPSAITDVLSELRGNKV